MHRDGDLEDRGSAGAGTPLGLPISRVVPSGSADSHGRLDSTGRAGAGSAGWLESGPDEAGETIEFETVILPARLDADVARLVAIASNRDGISIADLLGRAAAAYDWRVESKDPGPEDSR